MTDTEADIPVINCHLDRVGFGARSLEDPFAKECIPQGSATRHSLWYERGRHMPGSKNAGTECISPTTFSGPATFSFLVWLGSSLFELGMKGVEELIEMMCCCLWRPGTTCNIADLSFEYSLYSCAPSPSADMTHLPQHAPVDFPVLWLPLAKSARVTDPAASHLAG